VGACAGTETSVEVRVLLSGRSSIMGERQSGVRAERRQRGVKKKGENQTSSRPQEGA